MGDNLRARDGEHFDRLNMLATISAGVEAEIEPVSKPAAVYNAAGLILPSATPTAKLTWEAETNFTGRHKESQLKLRIRPKDNRFAVVIPAKAANSKRRTEIGFSMTQPEGLSYSFGEYIYCQLRSVVTKWKTLSQARKWVAKKSQWRDRVRQQWQLKSERRTRLSTKRRLGMVDTTQFSSRLTTYKPKRKSTVSILVPCLASKTIAVRLYERKGSKTKRGEFRKPQLMVWLPRKLIPHSKEFSMGVKFGINKIWKMYVTEYLGYVVSKWRTIDLTRKWYSEYRYKFVEFLNSLYAERQFSVIPRPWRLAPSTIPFAEKNDEYIREGYFPKQAARGKGYGVYLTRSGKHTLSLSTKHTRIAVRVSKNAATFSEDQKYYLVAGGNDEQGNKMVWVPTVDAIGCGVMPEGFLVGCSQTEDDATHDLVVNRDGTANLVGKDDFGTDVEACFDYSYFDDSDTEENSKLMEYQPVHDPFDNQ